MSKTLKSILTVLFIALFAASVPANAHESASHQVTIVHPWAIPMASCCPIQAAA